VLFSQTIIDDKINEVPKGTMGEKLAEYKIPEYVFLKDGLPKNAAGKVIKEKLRNEF
jgi:acyl-CoA synthetase (AMP-forming)/AMP-acid ligase II